MEAQVRSWYRPPRDGVGGEGVKAKCASRPPMEEEGVSVVMYLPPFLTNRNAYMASAARIIASARRWM